MRAARRGPLIYPVFDVPMSKWVDRGLRAPRERQTDGLFGRRRRPDIRPDNFGRLVGGFRAGERAAAVAGRAGGRSRSLVAHDAWRSQARTRSAAAVRSASRDVARSHDE